LQEQKESFKFSLSSIKGFHRIPYGTIQTIAKGRTIKPLHAKK